jgi:hypothetical protein
MVKGDLGIDFKDIDSKVNGFFYFRIWSTGRLFTTQ